MAAKYTQINLIDDFTIYHDYEGIEKLITGEWKCKNELSLRYYKLFNELTYGKSYKFHKVKAHSGDYYNEMVDKLAKEILGIN